jgi:hypothetical protein
MDPCPMWRVPSDQIEQRVRDAILGTMLREDVLRTAIRQTRQLDTSGDEYEERLRTIERLVQQKQHALNRATVDSYSAASESVREGLEIVRTQLARETDRLRAELTRLYAVTPRGISQTDEGAILETRDAIALVMADPSASQATLRGVIERLRIRGTLGVSDRADPTAIRLGRFAGWLLHTWQGGIATPDECQSVATFSNGGAAVVGAYTQTD